MGSPAHLAVLAGADSCIARVLDAVSACGAGEELLLLLCSDHGHETTYRSIDVEQALVDASLKNALESTEMAVVSQGSSALIYLREEAWQRLPALRRFFMAQNWVERCIGGDELEAWGLPNLAPLAMAVDMKKYARTNEFGIAGFTDIMLEREQPQRFDGFGQHGGNGAGEQQPFLLALGGGFPKGGKVQTLSAPIDLAPTILRHLNLVPDGMDGRPLHPS